jgi:hypothetical protein
MAPGRTVDTPPRSYLGTVEVNTRFEPRRRFQRADLKAELQEKISKLLLGSLDMHRNAMITVARTDIFQCKYEPMYIEPTVKVLKCNIRELALST